MGEDFIKTIKLANLAHQLEQKMQVNQAILKNQVGNKGIMTATDKRRLLTKKDQKKIERRDFQEKISLLGNLESVHKNVYDELLQKKNKLTFNTDPTEDYSPVNIRRENDPQEDKFFKITPMNISSNVNLKKELKHRDEIPIENKSFFVRRPHN